LFHIIKYGLEPPLAPADYESDMPAFAEFLADDGIWAVLAFIKSAWPPDIRARQARVTVQSDRRSGLFW
jgi:mono/diheme cytochrome c family protein